MTEQLRGDISKSSELPKLDVAKAIAAEREKYIADQGDLSEREKTLIVEAMKRAELVAVEAVQEVIRELPNQGEAWHAIHFVRANLENLKRTSQ